MQLLMGDPVKSAEAIALQRLRQAVKDLDGLLLIKFYLGRRQFDFPLKTG